MDYYDKKWAHNDGHRTANGKMNGAACVWATLNTVMIIYWVFVRCATPATSLRELLVRIGAPMAFFAVSFIGYVVVCGYALIAEQRHYQSHGLKPGAWRNW
jgi:hypothetical protein